MCVDIDVRAQPVGPGIQNWLVGCRKARSVTTRSDQGWVPARALHRRPWLSAADQGWMPARALHRRPCFSLPQSRRWWWWKGLPSPRRQMKPGHQREGNRSSRASRTACRGDQKRPGSTTSLLIGGGGGHIHTWSFESTAVARSACSARIDSVATTVSAGSNSVRHTGGGA